MAFATKYQVSYKDLAGNTHTVNLQVDGWGGAITTFTPGPNPCVIEYNGSDRYQPIVGSSVTIQVVYQSEVDDLFALNSQAIKVVVDSSLWYGFLIPGQYSRMFNRYKDYVTIVATDQLAALKNIPFEGSSIPYYGMETQAAIITNCLSKTGLTLDIADSVNIFEDSHTEGGTSTDSPFHQTYENQYKWYNEGNSNCYDPIADILKTYGAQLFQWSGYWWIRRANAVPFEHEVRLWDSGLFDPYPYLTKTAITNFSYLHSSGEITKMMPIDECVIISDIGRKKNMLISGEFEDFMWAGAGSTSDGTPIGWSTSSTPEYGNGGNCLSVGQNYSNTKYLSQRIEIGQPEKINIYLKYHGTVGASNTVNQIHIGVLLSYSDGGGTLYYLDETNGWGTVATTYEWTERTTGTDGAGDFENEFSLSLDVPVSYWATETSRALTIRVYEQEADGAASLFWDEINVTIESAVFSKNGIDLPFNNTTESFAYRFGLIKKPNIKLTLENVKKYSQVNSGTYYNKLEESIQVGDSWYQDYTMAVGDSFLYGSELSDTSLTSTWGIYGDTRADATIADILARQYCDGYNRPIDVLNAVIRSTFADYAFGYLIEDSILTDAYGWNKTFIPVRLSCDVRNMEWEGEWHEVAPIYTNRDIDWSSHEFGDDGAISDDLLTITDFDVTAATEEAVSEVYAAAAGEVLRVKISLTNSGSSDLPTVTIGGDSQTVAWGDNYIDYVCDSAGNKTIVLTGEEGDNLNLTAEITLYSITGI